MRGPRRRAYLDQLYVPLPSHPRTPSMPAAGRSLRAWHVARGTRGLTAGVLQAGQDFELVAEDLEVRRCACDCVLVEQLHGNRPAAHRTLCNRRGGIDSGQAMCVLERVCVCVCVWGGESYACAEPCLGCGWLSATLHKVLEGGCASWVRTSKQAQGRSSSSKRAAAGAGAREPNRPCQLRAPNPP